MWLGSSPHTLCCRKFWLAASFVILIFVRCCDAKAVHEPLLFATNRATLVPADFSWEDRLDLDISDEEKELLIKNVQLEAQGSCAYESPFLSGYLPFASESCGAAQADALTSFFHKLGAIERRCTKKEQPLAVIDHASHGTQVGIWLVLTEACPESPRRILWPTLRRVNQRKTELDEQIFDTLNFYVDRRQSPESSIQGIKAVMNCALANITQMVQELRNANPAVFLDIPVIFRSSASLDVPTVARETMMYAVRRAINDYRDATRINIFTSQHFTAARTGAVEAVEAFHAVNFYHLRFREEQKNVMGSLKPQELVGVLDIGASTLQLAYPVKEPVRGGAVRTVDVVLQTPLNAPQLLFNTEGLGHGNASPVSSDNNAIPLFATSFVNYGVKRALALLVKQYCKNAGSIQLRVGPERVLKVVTPLRNGTCHFPCFLRGWKQDCRIGNNMVLTANQHNRGPRYSVRVLGNALTRPAAFCSVSHNPAIRLARLRENCKSVGLSPKLNDSARTEIPHCHSIVGTGDYTLCDALIDRYIMKLQFPANQDATFVGASIPREVGHADSIRMISPFRVTGSVTNEAIQSLIALRWLNLTAPGNVIQNLKRVLPAVCNMKADLNNLTLSGRPPSITGLGVDSSKSPRQLLVLTENSAYICFRLSYLIHLLRAIKAGGHHRPNVSSDSEAVPGILFDIRPSFLPQEVAPNFSATTFPPTISSLPEAPLLINTTRVYNMATPDDSENFDFETYSRSRGMVLRLMFTPEIYTHIYVLGALHWKNEYYMSPLESAFRSHTTAVGTS